MLVDPIYNGSGIGNQLHCYVTTRCLAIDKGYDFKVVFPERWKGKFFKNIYLPSVDGFEIPVEGQPPTKMPDGMKYYCETSSDYDPFIMDIPDNYIVHGNLQGEKYFEKHKEEIQHWLKVDELKLPDDICIINFRGGDYAGYAPFFLPHSYWNNAIRNMLKINPRLRFEVHTDDVQTALRFFPFYNCIHDAQLNWTTIRYAKYLILSNSSFGWFPAWLGDAKMIIAPMHWQRHNLGFWQLEQNKTKCFTYQKQNGELVRL